MLYIFLALSGLPVSLIQQHWFCLLLALLPFDQMSNEVGAITVFSRLEIIEDRQGKHGMYLMHFIITAHNSKFWLFVSVK